MSWSEDMKRDIVKLADPQFELQPDDAVEFEVQYSEGYDPTYSGAIPSASATVRVRRDGDLILYKEWSGEDDFNTFWVDLMVMGSA